LGKAGGLEGLASFVESGGEFARSLGLRTIWFGRGCWIWWFGGSHGVIIAKMPSEILRQNGVE